MKVVEIETVGEYEQITGIEIKINDAEVFSIYEGEPEVMTLCRNLSDCHNISNLMN